MKILQIIADGGLGGIGGAPVNVLALCEGLIRKGHEVFLSTQPNCYLFEEAAKLGIQVKGIDFFSSRIDLRIPLRIRRIVEEIGPDVVHVHVVRAAFHLSFLSLRTTPVVYTVRGYHFTGQKGIKRHLSIFAERRIAKKVDCQIFVSDADKRTAESAIIVKHCKKCRVIRNGIDTAKLGRPWENPDTRKIAFVGRFTAQKDPFMFLRVVKALSAEGYSGIMIGGGELEEQVRRQIRVDRLDDVVEITGPLPHEEALLALSKCGVLLMTSVWEGFSRVPLEAMCLRIPVVAASVNGMDEIISDGETGLIVKDRQNVEMYISAIRRLENKAMKSIIVDKARERVIADFAQERVVEEHIRIYSALLGKDS